jgi:dCMP deaminase
MGQERRQGPRKAHGPSPFPHRLNRKRPPDGARRARRCRNWPTATTAAYPRCAAPLVRHEAAKGDFFCPFFKPVFMNDHVDGERRTGKGFISPMALDSWDERYLALAMQVSQWSKDPSSKMGAVIADVKGRVVASGYNGFPEHVHDCPEILNNKEKKYQMVVHAEANAALIAGAAAIGGTVYLYGRRPICGPCAGILIQAGIKRAVAIPLRWTPFVRQSEPLVKV